MGRGRAKSARGRGQDGSPGPGPCPPPVVSGVVGGSSAFLSSIMSGSQRPFSVNVGSVQPVSSHPGYVTQPFDSNLLRQQVSSSDSVHREACNTVLQVQQGRNSDLTSQLQVCSTSF
jgi:hypothetical protein